MTTHQGAGKATSGPDHPYRRTHDEAAHHVAPLVDRGRPVCKRFPARRDRGRRARSRLPPRAPRRVARGHGPLRAVARARCCTCSAVCSRPTATAVSVAGLPLSSCSGNRRCQQYGASTSATSSRTYNLVAEELEHVAANVWRPSSCSPASHAAVPAAALHDEARSPGACSTAPALAARRVLWRAATTRGDRPRPRHRARRRCSPSEPTGALDQASGWLVVDGMRARGQPGRRSVMATHNPLVAVCRHTSGLDA